MTQLETIPFFLCEKHRFFLQGWLIFGHICVITMKILMKAILLSRMMSYHWWHWWWYSCLHITMFAELNKCKFGRLLHSMQSCEISRIWRIYPCKKNWKAGVKSLGELTVLQNQILFCYNLSNWFKIVS